jgi:hypothetical protein
VLSWTRIYRLPSTNSKKNDKSTTSGPTSSQKNHLTPAASAIADNNERQRHIEKMISPDLKTGEKTKLPI